jgi:Uma2 family endonuclease
MATTSQSDARLTYDDLVRMPDDGMRHEIIDGVHYVTPSPVLRHQTLVRRLLVAIANYLDAHPGAGEVFSAPLDTVFTPSDVVEPDLLLVAGDQLDILTEPNVQGAPALVIEILSPGTKTQDLGVKQQLYDRGGVREYWVIDPETNTVGVFRRAEDGGFPEVAGMKVSADTDLSTPLLPGLTIPLAKLFRP